MTPEFLIALYEHGRFAEFVQLSEGVGDADVLCMRAFAKAAGWGCTKDVVGAEVIVKNILGEIKNRAQNGIAVSQANLAKIFRDGLGVPRDYAVAVGWCRKAAEQGNARAQTNLGSVYSNGHGVAKDDVIAVDWYRKAAELGYAIAQFCLAVRYANGRGVEKDYALAAEWCRKAAEQGYAKAQYDLAERYENGCGVEKDDALAVEWYRRAAEQGDAKAQFNLAVRYEDGRGVNKDDSLAVEWYRKAAEQGNANAQCNLGVMYEDGRGVVKDESLAVEWYRRAAEQKQADALFNIGRMYCNGIGVVQDDKEAVKSFRDAAELGDAQAQRNLGLMYYKGRGVAKNYEEAVKWCHNAAEHGDEIAQCFLGLMYSDGKGVAKNDVEAVKWYRKAAEQGDQDAQFNLALMYENGRGVDKDEVLAAEWFRKSAEQGCVAAQFNLGFIYEHGHGVAKNEMLAAEWYRKAAEQGHVAAQCFFKANERQLSGKGHHRLEKTNAQDVNEVTCSTEFSADKELEALQCVTVDLSVNDVVECAKRILREPKKMAGDMDLLISELDPEFIKAIADGRIRHNHLKELTNGLSEIIATNGCPRHMLNLFDEFLRAWIPCLQEERTTFSELLHDALQKDEKGIVSLYDTFVEICRGQTKNLNDIEIRYQNLRNNGYVVRDETDICVYVTKVAAKHSPKFKWLYDNLFREFPAVFQREIDLVVWGCGCGLDLLALYDQAMQQNNPQLWLTVRSVTLIDISSVAVQRAKEIADVLFPMARGKITTCHCDFKDSSFIQLEIPRSFIYTPRLHLVSNVIDLLSEEQLCRFAQVQKASCARSYYGKPYFNEIFVTFSPEYKNWDWVATKLKMDKYRQIWGEKSSDMRVGGGEPDKCAYATFSLNNCSRSPVYQVYYNGNRCLYNLVRERNRCVDEGCDDESLKGLQQALFRIVINGKNFFDCYEWVDIQTYEDKYGQRHIGRLLFVPLGETEIAPCVVYFEEPRSPTIDITKEAWEELHEKAGIENEDVKGYVSVTKKMLWRNGLLAGDVDYDRYRMENAQDFSEAFVVNPRGAKPLPDVDTEMDKKQKKVIFGRTQLRRIRGGAGCGKTTTMLWHSVMSILRTHQPVLVACKTVTLFSHNQRRMAATILAQVPGLNHVERNLIQFKTIDKYLCEYSKDMNSCDMSFCGRCRRRFNREMERNNEVDPGRIVPVACGTGNAKLPKCVLLENHGRNQHALVHDLDASEKDLLCKSCKKKLVDALCRKDRAVLSKAESFGAVMVDEIQSVGPDLVQALYNLTEEGNPYREFYVFCDERQCLETEAVEMDTRVKKLRVKTPKGGDGRQFRGDWFGLSKPYRQLGELSGVLSEVAKTFQKSTDVKYGNDETEYPPYNGLTGAFNVLIAQNCPNSLCEEVLKAVNHLKGVGETRITVVCDSVLTVYSLLRNANVPNWLNTHKPGATFLEEQKLRNDFEETENHVGLTTIQLAQGWDLDCVILVITQNKDVNAHQVESVLTGITRAKKQLRIIDASSTHWVYEHLKRFN